MDQRVLQENYNITRDDVWQFVPSISRDQPYDFVICLIWTMPIKYKLLSDLTYEVSCWYLLLVANMYFAYYSIFKNPINFWWFINYLHWFSAGSHIQSFSSFEPLCTISWKWSISLQSWFWLPSNSLDWTWWGTSYCVRSINWSPAFGQDWLQLYQR